MPIWGCCASAGRATAAVTVAQQPSVWRSEHRALRHAASAPPAPPSTAPAPAPALIERLRCQRRRTALPSSRHAARARPLAAVGVGDASARAICVHNAAAINWAASAQWRQQQYGAVVVRRAPVALDAAASGLGRRAHAQCAQAHGRRQRGRRGRDCSARNSAIAAAVDATAVHEPVGSFDCAARRRSDASVCCCSDKSTGHNLTHSGRRLSLHTIAARARPWR